MEKLIELNIDSSIRLSNKILNIKKSECIYIPILPNSKILVSKNSKVKIGMPLVNSKEGITTSPISGDIIAIKKISTINGEIDAIEIKNNFIEESSKDSKVKKNILNIKKEVLDKALALFQTDLTNKKEIVLNCIDDEPYTLTESFYLFIEYPNFLEVLDKLSDIYKLKISIAVKSSSNFSINELMNYLGMYPSIKLEIIPNLYLLGNNKLLLKYLNMNCDDTLVIKASEFYHLSNFLKKGRLKTDKLITISGNNIKTPCIVRTKIGTPLKEVLKKVDTLDNVPIFIANGLMSGRKIDIDNFVITEDLTSVMIIKKETIDKSSKKESKCLNCGACIDICPVGLNPLLLKNEEYYLKHQSECLNCGLCSYICPAYINFNSSNRKEEKNG